jgi:hypothetical protein
MSHLQEDEEFVLGEAVTDNKSNRNRPCCYYLSSVPNAIWIMLFCFALVLIFGILSISAIAKTDSFTNTVRMLQFGQSATPFKENSVGTGTSMFSVSSSILSSNNPSILLFGAFEVYYTKTGNPGEEFHSIEKKTIKDLQSVDLKDVYYSPIKVSLSVEFNARVTEGKTTRIGTNNRENKYMSFNYNITSRHIHFSTIKLVELEFDTLDQSLKPVRSIILCTKNPQVIESTTRCEHFVNNGNILTLYGEKVIIIPETGPKEGKEKNNSTTEEEKKDEVSYQTRHNERSREQSQQDEIMGIRMYNIVFYEQIIVNATSSTRGSTVSYKEREMLTIVPTLC